MRKRLLAAMLLVTMSISCETIDSRYTKDGVNYNTTEGVFRGRWWSYYERGTNLMRGGYYEAAEADFRTALKGRSRDSWRARTYGLHFVEYFPNREIAVALLKSGKVDEAQRYLERSLERIDTARAHHFLDLVKREQIAKGTRSDTTPPRFTTSIENGMLLSSRDLQLAIDATDDSGVDQLTVNGKTLYQRGSRESLSYKREMLFVEGEHEIIIEASDLSDKSTAESVQITVDLTGPTLGIREPEDARVTNESTLRLAGSTVDRNGVVAVEIDGRLIAESDGEYRVQFDTQLMLQDGENTFVVVARDRAGNETVTAIRVYKGTPGSTASMLWQLEQTAPELLKVATASPADIAVLLAGAFAAAQEEEVRIKLKSPKQDRPWRNELAIRVAGEVIANTKVAKLMINGIPFEDLTGEPKESFNRRIPLTDEMRKSGVATLEISVVANDDAGNQASEIFDLRIEPVELNTKASRMPLAVLAFSGVSEELSANLRTISEQAINDSGRFRVLERQELQAVLSEQQLSDALADVDSALQLGRLTPAHVFLVGQVMRFEKGIEISVRIISTETGELMVPSIDAHIEDASSFASVQAGCKALAEEISRRFPRISGEIQMVRDSRVLINWGADDGVVEGTRALVVYQEEPWVDEDTGEILEEGQVLILGQVQLTQIRATNSFAEKVVIEGVEDVAFEKNMPTITM